MTTRALAILLLAATAWPAPSVARTTGTPSKAFVAQQFQIWNAALQTGDPQRVAALYCATGAVLIPTVSNTLRTSRAEIADYFQHFLAMRPEGEIDTAYIRILDPTTAIDSGIYTFHLVKDHKPEDVQARYTFVYRKVNGTWCIIEHHSSAMPETGRAVQER